MPWQEVCPMDEKVRFIGALRGQEESMTELCERFGISRKTGYKLYRRYQAEGLAGIAERSRAPHVIPWAISEAQAEAIVGCAASIRAGVQKAAREVARARARTGLARIEHNRRVAAPPGA